MNGYDIARANFHVARLSGSGREIGQSLGQWLKETNPGFVAFFTRERFSPESKGFDGFKELKDSCDRACPGILGEIVGFAEAIGAENESVAFWAWSALPGSNCSHAPVAPRASATGTALVMRSYERRPGEDDLLLCVTRRMGAHAHLGCSMALYGRMDGMNEKGFSVTISGGMAAVTPHSARCVASSIKELVVRVSCLIHRVGSY
jgi:predicted choloylglycine hydrolase